MLRLHIFGLNKLVLAVAILFGCSVQGWTAEPATLRTLAAVHALTNLEASRRIPAVFEATVVYFRSYEKTMFVQDGVLAIYIQATTDAKLVPGDRVLIRGTTHESFRPFVLSNDITLLRHGALPTPAPANFDQLERSQYDCALVTVRAQVFAADVVSSSDTLSTSLHMLTSGGEIDAVVDSDDASKLADLLDAHVEVTGASSGIFDGKMQQTGIMLHVSSMSDITILKRAATSPWSLAITPMDEILTSYHVRNFSQRVRVRGTITYYQPGYAAVLQSGKRSLWIQTKTSTPLRIGDLADATGFPSVHDGFLALADGEIHDSNAHAPIVPYPSTWHELSGSQRIFDLVSVEGKVVAEVREATQDEYVLTAEGHLFTAIYRHPPLNGAALVPEMKRVLLGSRIRVSGICMAEDANPFNGDVPFNVLLRSFNDIAVVAEPSWLTVRNLSRVVSILLLIMAAVGVWGAILKIKVRRQTADISARIDSEAALERRMAQMEQQRSHILEDINGSRPLTEILEEITEMVSFGLNGAPCWCQVTDGAQLGDCPQDKHAYRIVLEQIPARSGPALGVLFAGLNPLIPADAGKLDALSMGARLASLAIETRKLYSDLLHRSEFDLLTDINNRFSLDKHLDSLIDEARQNAGMFGLIYIDLDKFKQVNDLYGHQAGDLYLQEMSLRMKSQMRSGDILARLGGDEFAALITTVRNRAGAEEIAQRLERCFDQPFSVNEIVLQGSASVGLALYPEDGTTKDSLLSAADAAMYKAKNSKRQNV